MNRVTTSVLNAVAPTAADIVVSNGALNITTCPSMQYEFIKTAGNGLVPSLLPTALILEVTPTAAPGITYTLLLTQYVMPAGRIITRVLSYTTPTAGATPTSICDFLRLQLASYTDIQIAGSGTATLVLTGSLTSPIFTAVNTSTATMTVANIMSTAAVASNTTATPTVITTSAAHGFVVGQVLTLSGATVGKIANGTYVVASTPLGTTLTLQTLSGFPLGGVATTTGTLTLNAQVSRGQYSDLLTAGVSGAVAGNTYSQVPFTFGDESGLDSNLNQPSQPINRHTLYVSEADPDFAAFKTRMNEVLNAYVSGGTTSDPALIAVQH